jgi:hypothetical protein
MDRSLRNPLARLAMAVLASACLATAQVAISAPATVKAGAVFDVALTGPATTGDIVTITAKDLPMGQRSSNYSYFKPPAAKLTAFDEPGEYELRVYSAANRSELLARKPITVEATPATLDAPESVEAGAPVKVAWTGPANSADQIRWTAVGAPANTRLAYTYARLANPASLNAPDKAGQYELRYVTGQSSLILASRPITVGGTAASLTAPEQVQAGAVIGVGWEGPDNPGDVINIVPVGATNRAAWGYPGNGNPVNITAPREVGEYEIRYQTGQSRVVLARAALRVTPAAAEPGELLVAGSGEADLSGTAVEVILDASGSMLQRIGGARRIDIAKETLVDLTSEMIPAGTLFALRVFGKQAGSCQTDLEIPPAPLNAAASAAKIAAIQANNNAKTPIAASIGKVLADLRGVSGEFMVVLVTDGEETCEGDPAAAIEALRAAGFTVKVNIVGFAIGDDTPLKESFQDWADLGGGAYFDAADATGLREAFLGALQQSFEVLSSGGVTVADGVAGGPAIVLPPGAYTVKTRSVTQSVTIEAGKTASVTLASR